MKPKTSKPVVPPSPLAREGWGERAASEPLAVREGSATPYLAKPQQTCHSRESGNPAPFVALTEVVTLNPRGFDERPNDDDLVSFIPMKAVEEESGRLSAVETRRWGDVKKGYTPFQDSDVIFAKITPCMENGKYALATGLHGGRAAGSTEFHVFRPKPELDSKYLLHFLFTPALRSRARMSMKGAAGQLRVPTQFFNDVQIPLPSLDKQRRIVAELETQLTRLDASVTALKHVQANLKRYRASVLKAACEGRLVRTEAEFARSEGRSYESAAELLRSIVTARLQRGYGRGQYQAPLVPEAEKSRPLPEGWTWAIVEQLSNVVRGASPRPAGDPKYFGGSVPWITVGPVTADQKPYLTSVPETLTEAGKDRSRFIEPQTLLLTNSGATLGVPKITLIGGCINDGVAALLDVDYPMKLYLLYFLRSQTKALRGLNQGAAQPNLNTSIIKAINVPLPPLAEQQRIVTEVERRLSVIEELEATVAANLKRATCFKQSVLRHAFG